MKAKGRTPFTQILAMTMVIPLLLSMKSAPIRMGIIPFAPYYYTTDKGEQSGWMYDAVAQITRKLGKTLATSDLSPKRAVKELGLGHIDFIITIDTFPNLNKVAHIGKKALTTIKLAAYARSGTPPMKSQRDLIGKDVIIIQGYNYGGLIDFIKERKNNVTYHVVENHELGLKMMRHHRADYLLAYKGPTDVARKSVEIPDLSHSVLKKLNLYFIFSKKLADSKMILSHYEKLYSWATRR